MLYSQHTERTSVSTPDISLTYKIFIPYGCLLKVWRTPRDVWDGHYSKSNLCYDRRSVGQSVSVTSPPPPPSGAQDMIFVTIRQLRVGHSDEWTRLSFEIAADLRQRSHSWILVQRDSEQYFTVSASRLSPPRRPGPLIYTPQQQGGPVIPPSTGFPFLASYSSQGYGGGIRTRLHKGKQTLAM
jgi:hypothetical protein